MGKLFSPIPSNVLERICRVIAEGMTGAEIVKYLPECRINVVDPGGTKWKVLHNSFALHQNKIKVSNDILKFIQMTIHPSRFLNKKEEFETVRSELNMVLSFIGLELGKDGKFRPCSKSETIDDAQKRANSLLLKLKERNVHKSILNFCRAELLNENYFHAVFEATKSVADKIRSMTSLTSDGNELVDSAFSLKAPLIKINLLQTETDESEHKGLANLLRGFFSMFRNTTAHVPKVKWEIEEDDALDIMSMASFFHRKLDNALALRSASSTL